MFPRRTVRYASRAVRNHSTARIPKPKLVARPCSDTRPWRSRRLCRARLPINGSDRASGAGSAPVLTIFGKLPRALRKRAHASGNMQAKRKKVAGEMLVARRNRENAGRVDQDSERDSNMNHQRKVEILDPRRASAVAELANCASSRPWSIPAGTGRLLEIRMNLMNLRMKFRTRMIKQISCGSAVCSSGMAGLESQPLLCKLCQRRDFSCVSSVCCWPLCCV